MRSILLNCLALCLPSLSLAGEPVDWAAKADQVVGHWKSKKIVPRKPLPDGLSVEGEEWDLVIRQDGTSTLSISREGAKLEKLEQNYCIGDKMLAFYEPKYEEAGSANIFGWRVNGGKLELDLLGAASVTVHFEKVEQAGPGQPATRSESDSEGGDKPQPEAEGRSR
jgi:hypothetical protein